MRRLIEWGAKSLPLKTLLTTVDIFTNNHPRMIMYNNAFTYAKASNVKGDYLEFGVYQGKSFALAYHHAMIRGFTDMRFFAFDSFQGLPPETRDYELPSNTLHEGQFSSTEAAFKQKITRDGVDLKRVVVVEGWFDKTLTEDTKETLSLGKATVVMIDCDLYESAVPVLEFITDLLVPGAVLMFDDWFLYEGNPEHGVQAATREWLARNPEIGLVEYHKFGWHGNSFLARRMR